MPRWIAGLLLLLLVRQVRAADIVGTWEHRDPDGGFVMRLVFNADGTGVFEDEAVRYTLSGAALAVKFEDETVTYTAAFAEGAMTLSGGDLDEPLRFARVQGGAAPPAPQPPVPPVPQPPVPQPAPPPDWHGGMMPAPRPGPGIQPAPQPAANPLVGRWRLDQRVVIVRADGTGSLAGAPFRYRVDGNTLVYTDDADVVVYTFTVDAQKLTLAAEGETLALTRLPDAAPSPSGVFVSSESYIDQNMAMFYTQYLVLFPDGTVAWAKTESGESEAVVADCRRRLGDPQNRGPTHGRWQATPDGSVTVQWQVWDKRTCRAVIDADGNQGIERMGVLEEGATLLFKRRN